MGRSIEVEAVGAQVRLTLREFEGVGRAERTALLVASPKEAQALIEDIGEAIKEAAAQSRAIVNAERDRLVDERKRIDARLTELDRQAPLTCEAF